MAPNEQIENDSDRFNALLNPIRDITSSWGIDVAKELTEYAESLGINIGDGNLDNNIQSSDTFVPVDFAKAALLVQGSTSIYSRKVEHLYSLVYKAVSSLNHIHGKSNETNEDSGTNLKDADADALLQLDEIDFLVLDNDGDEVPQVDPKTISLSDENKRHSSAYRDETRLLPVPPMLAHKSAALSDQVGGIQYKMLSAEMHSSGALIMRGCPPVKEDLDKLPSEGNENIDNDITQPFDDQEVDMCNVGEDDYASPSPYNNLGELYKENRPAQEDEELSKVGSQVIKETAALYGVKFSGQVEKKDKREKDYFRMLEPHEAVAGLDKPLRIGKSFRRPRQNSSNCESTVNPWTGSESDLYHVILPEIPEGASVKRYVSFPALQTSFTSILRKRQAAKRKRSMLKGDGLNASTDVDMIADIADDAMSAPDVDRGCDEHASEFEHDGGDGFGQLDNLPFDDAFDSVDQTGATELLLDTEEQLGEEFVNIASSFEEICQKYLKMTSWMWEQRATDAELVKRVEDWKSRIEPLLEEEEQRREFDISQYGKEIMRALEVDLRKKDTNKARISHLIQNPAKFEVCRMFLATLQLANLYKLEIIPPAESSVSDFYVRMLPTDKGNGSKGVDNNFQAPGKRSRQPGSTPKSARRQPLRPRLITQNFTDM